MPMCRWEIPGFVCVLRERPKPNPLIVGSPHGGSPWPAAGVYRDAMAQQPKGHPKLLLFVDVD